MIKLHQNLVWRLNILVEEEQLLMMKDFEKHFRIKSSDIKT